MGESGWFHCHCGHQWSCSGLLLQSFPEPSEEHLTPSFRIPWHLWLGTCLSICLLYFLPFPSLPPFLRRENVLMDATKERGFVVAERIRRFGVCGAARSRLSMQTGWEIRKCGECESRERCVFPNLWNCCWSQHLPFRKSGFGKQTHFQIRFT